MLTTLQRLGGASGVTATAGAGLLDQGPFSELTNNDMFVRKPPPPPMERKSTVYERMIHGDPAHAVRRSRSSVDMLPWKQTTLQNRRAVTQKVLGSSRSILASGVLMHETPYVPSAPAADHVALCRHGYVLPRENGQLAADEQLTPGRGSIARHSQQLLYVALSLTACVAA